MDWKTLITDVADFPKPGVLFKDICPLLADPVAFSNVIHAFAHEWRGKVDMIVALESRGFMFGPTVAFVLGVPFVPVRKKGKLPGKTESVTYALEYGTDTVEISHGLIKPGMRVLVLDDILATGGTASAACDLVEKVGGKVAGCAFLLELKALGGVRKLSGRKVSSLCVDGEVMV